MSDLPEGWAQATLEELTIPTEQVEPLPDATFTYIDIGSVDRQTKRVVSPQVLLGKDETPTCSPRSVNERGTVGLATSMQDAQIQSRKSGVLVAPCACPKPGAGNGAQACSVLAYQGGDLAPDFGQFSR